MFWIALETPSWPGRYNLWLTLARFHVFSGQPRQNRRGGGCLHALQQHLCQVRTEPRLHLRRVEVQHMCEVKVKERRRNREWDETCTCVKKKQKNRAKHINPNCSSQDRSPHLKMSQRCDGGETRDRRTTTLSGEKDVFDVIIISRKGWVSLNIRGIMRLGL